MHVSIIEITGFKCYLGMENRLHGAASISFQNYVSNHINVMFVFNVIS